MTDERSSQPMVMDKVFNHFKLSKIISYQSGGSGPKITLKLKKYQYFFFFINFKNINSNFLKNTKTLIYQCFSNEEIL